jgi:hypothetical protein
MMLAVVGLLLWMLLQPKTTVPLKVLGLLCGLMLFGPISEWIMNSEAAASPWKFDYSLQCIDQALGITAFEVARNLGRHPERLFAVYATLGHCMMLWYGLNLMLKKGRPKPLLFSYLIAYGLAPLFYLVLPAYGPRHAFKSVFPLGNPHVAPVLVYLPGWPNAIPSLHLATAILLVYFSAQNRFMRAFAWVYLAGTAAATLAFEHYVIDLVVAVPYACFVIHAAEGRFASAARHLFLTLAWMMSIRFATPLLIAHPWILRMAVLATAAAGVAALRERCSNISGKQPELPQGNKDVETVKPSKAPATAGHWTARLISRPDGEGDRL